MSKRFATTAVRRRWGACATYARQREAAWPRRSREKSSAGGPASSTYSYLALYGGGDSHGLELAILKLIIDSPERSRCFPVSALLEAFKLIRPAVFDEALACLQQQGILIRRGELIGLTRPVRSLVDLGLKPRA
jgi:hypothetical protein